MLINVAIDGPSASGKSTIAKRLCAKLGYKHLDTGAMYRCVALKVKQNRVDINNDKALKKLMNSTTIQLTQDGKVYLDGKDVTTDIRTDEISLASSDVSTKQVVREHLVKMQQEIAKDKGYIMDGRDIGTVVLPDAEVKVYMTATAEARAMRRYLENQSKGIDSNLLNLKYDIVKRDYQDTHRKNSPLKKAKDAVEIDTSNMSIDEVVDEIMRLIYPFISEEEEQ